MRANLVAATVGITFILVLWMVYLSFFDLRAPPIRIVYSHPVATLGKAVSRLTVVDAGPVRRGGVMYSYREYCITSEHQVLRNERWLYPIGRSNVRPIPFPLLPTRVLSKVGCESASFSNQIPVETPPGDYWFRAKWVYMLDWNPVAIFRWNWPDVKVTVE